MKWQPIDTAPKDKLILVYDPTLFPESIEDPPGSMQYRISESRYRRGVYISCWRAGDSLNRAHWADGQVKGAPTHWMPLPEPPEGEAA